jgi:hypothetical protein
MSVRKVQLRRGTGAENNAFIGAVGEITVNTTNNTIRVHDGATLGGSETAKSNLSNVLPTQNLDFNEYKIVNVADPVDDQDVATKAWVLANGGGGGGGGSLATLSDVDVAGVAPGEYLKYSGTEWINDSLSTADLSDGADIAMLVGGTLTANLDGNALTSSAWISPMTLNLTGTVITGSVSFDGSTSVDLSASLNDTSITNAKLVNDSVSIGGSYDLALGGTLNLDGGLSITGSTLSVGNVATASALFTAVTLSIGGSVITGSVSFDGSTSVEILADITPLSITDGMIANDTISNAKLVHDYITFNNHEVRFGEEVTINGTDGEISVVANQGVYTIGLAGTIVATSAISLAKTINLAGNLTGSVSLDNALAAVTLTATLGTITNAQLEHSFIAINDFEVDLGNNLDVVGANGVSVTMDEPNSIMTIGLGTISVDNLSTKNIAFSDLDSSENIPLGGTLTFLGVANETSVFILNGEVNIGLANDVEVQGNLTVNSSASILGDLYASSIIESSPSAGISLQDNTAINANLDVYNPTGALLHGTTVYLYVKYGANSLANGEYFHVFKTNDNGSIRQVIPLTLLQDGGQDKLAIKPSGIYEYEAVAGDYTNAGNVPNASFVVDTEGGTYTYQIRCYTSNDDGTEFEVAFSLNGANPAPTYSILFTSNDGSAYDREYLISYDSALNIQANVGAISTFNQTEKALSVNSSTGNLIVEGSVSSYDLDVKNSEGSSFLNVASNNVNINIYGGNGNTDGFYINGGVNGNENFFMAQPNDLGGDGILYINGLLKVWNNGVINDNTFNVDNQANVTILGGDFSIQDTNLVDKLKLNNASGILEAVEISSFIGGTLTLSGNVVATTQAPNTNNTTLATTEYVDLAVSGGGESRYTCTDPVFVANAYTLTAPASTVAKDAYFLQNGGTVATLNLFELTNNDFDGYVLALFNTDATATITIDADGTQTISGDTTKDIPAGGCLTIMARGTSWYIM